MPRRRKKEWPRVRRRERRGKVDYVVDLGMVEELTPSGKKVHRRRTICRATIEEAEAEAQKARDRRKELGALALRLRHEQLVDAVRAYEILQGRHSLEDAARFLVDRKPHSALVTVQQAFEQLLERQEKRIAGGELGRRHLISTRSVLKPFVAAFASTLIADVRQCDIREWLDGRKFGSPVTKRNALLYLSLLFGCAVEREWIQTNPCRGIKPPKIKHTSPKFHTVEQVQSILAAAAENDERLIPRLAIGYFAGIRAAELDKLQWADVHFDAGIIAISEHIAKSGIPRAVTLAPILMEWLLPHRKHSGPIGLLQKAFRKHRIAVCQQCHVPWVQNAQRHTFATYHLALHQNAALTAKEMGHVGGERLLYRHYAHAGVAKAEAATYWRIRPASVRAARAS